MFTGDVINALLVAISGAVVIGWVQWLIEHQNNRSFSFANSAYWAIVVRIRAPSPHVNPCSRAPLCD